MKNLTVFGGSGKTGIAFTELALSKGYRVTTISRSVTHLKKESSNYHNLRGFVLSKNDVDMALHDADAVLSFIGHRKDSPADIQTNAIRLIIQEMKVLGKKRLISLTGTGVFVKGDLPSPTRDVLTFMLKVADPKRLRDGEQHVQEIVRSELDWTILRANLMTGGSARPYVLGPAGKGKHFSVSRDTVAQACLDILDDPKTFRTSPCITPV